MVLTLKVGDEVITKIKVHKLVFEGIKEEG
jgi:hypothetical protein